MLSRPVVGVHEPESRAPRWQSDHNDATVACRVEYQGIPKFQVQGHQAPGLGMRRIEGPPICRSLQSFLGHGRDLVFCPSPEVSCRLAEVLVKLELHAPAPETST